MYRTTSVMALGLFLGLAPIGALAQTQTDDTDLQQQQQLTQPTDDQEATGTDALRTDDQEATDTETDITDTETDITDTETDLTDTETDADVATDEDLATDEADVAADVDEVEEDVIAEQDADEMLATSLMGASVNLADESIGTVSDLIITSDHTVRGVVVGVGGFLGIGEKRVALPLERLNVRTTEPGVVEITADVTREELEEKETFRTAAQIRQEEEAAQAEQQQQMQQPQTFD